MRITLTLDEDVFRAVKVRGARTGKRNTQVIEDALRRGLGFDLLDRRSGQRGLREDGAMSLALEAQHATRRRP